MEKNQCILGGEPSGHVIFRQKATTGDGALAALKMIECMRFFDKPVSALTNDVSLYPSLLENVIVTEKPPLEENKTIQDTLKEGQALLGDKGRIVLRYSGTESKCRVMVEGEEKALVQKVCDLLVNCIKEELA
jgi:phosphoglucosamine mutase